MTPSSTASPKDRLVPPLFDHGLVLARLNGNTRLFQEIILLFLENSPHLLKEARDATNPLDTKSLERATHKLKGVLGQIGADGIADVVRQLEREAEGGDPLVIEKRMAVLEAAVARLEVTLSGLIEL